MNKRIVFTLFIAFVTLVFTSSAFADAPCTPVYGGGMKADGTTYCMETIMAMQPNSTTNAGDVTQNTSGSSFSMTKGGLPIQQTPSNLTHQPNTGPEMLGLLGLIPTAVVGWKLRKKA